MDTATPYTVDRTGWSSGPWDGEPDRVDWVHAGFACFVLRHPNHGAWCGYVGVPKEHPAYGKSGDDVDAEAHGGINYAAKCSGLICHVPQPGMPDDVWWFGFDCGHAFDLCPGTDASLARVGIRPRIGLPGGLRETYRDLRYVRRQVERLAEQLAG